MSGTERTRRTALSRPVLSAALGLALAVTGLAAAPAVAAQEAPRPGASAEAGIALVTLTYNDAQAPSYQAEIAQSTVIWNGAVTNVRLVEVSGPADFYYVEGTFPGGSTTETDGQGHGTIYLDEAHNHQYNSLRIITHETGHILGLPDHYSGPCSELMSGGGPGASCTNAYPNASEAARVDALWALDLAEARPGRVAAAR